MGEDPTQGRGADVVRFWTRRFDHIDRTLEGLALQSKLMAEVVSDLARNMAKFDERLTAIERSLREVKIDMALQANQILNAQQTAHQAILQSEPPVSEPP